MYLGFFEEGMLVICDSVGVVCMCIDVFGGLWMFVFCFSLARVTDG